MAPEVEAPYAEICILSPRPELGRWSIEGGQYTAPAWERFCFLRLAPMPEACVLRTMIRWQPEPCRCGLVLRAGEALDDSYMVYLEPSGGLLKFDRWLGDRSHLMLSYDESKLGNRHGTRNLGARRGMCSFVGDHLEGPFEPDTESYRLLASNAPGS